MSFPYDFETLVDRRGQGSLRESMTLPQVKAAGATPFSAAEMDFPTAPCIVEACRKRAEGGIYGFTLCDEPYRAAVLRWMKLMRGWKAEGDWIVPAYGTIFSLSTAIRAFTKLGGNVLIQRPVYDRYDQAILRNGRTPVSNSLKLMPDGHYEIDFADLEQKLSDPNTGLMVLCNPQNPVGRIWRRAELRQVAALAKEYGVVVFSDEIFAEFDFLDEPVVPFASLPEAREVGISCTGLGKAFNFTGVNHANNLIPGEALRAAFMLQRNRDHYGSMDPMAYTAVLAAYNSDGGWNKALNNLLMQNGGAVRDFFAARMPSVRLAPQEGTFTLWIDWRGLGLSDSALFSFLEEKALFQTNRGAEYGVEGQGFCRMNIATPAAEIQKALKRLEQAAREAGILPYSA